MRVLHCVPGELILCQKYDFIKKIHNHYETLSKWGPNEDFIFTKFRYDWVKIVDFLIKAYSALSNNCACTIIFFAKKDFPTCPY